MKTLLTFAVLLVASFASSTTASASHSTYRYDGRCLHIGGEQHMIDALRAMDVLYDAPCVRTRSRASVAVQREIGRAIGDVQSTDARLLLIKSQGLVGRFVGTGNGLFLDSAAQLVTQAIAAEQLAYERLQANDRFSSRRAPIRYDRDFARPNHAGDGFGFNAYRAPINIYDRGLGYGGGYRSNYHRGYGYSSGSGSHRNGCNSNPSRGFSLHLGR